ncbi:MAG: tetratricopeptide repeat protein [Cyanobacteria bacterium CAN_BIN43]|nr:tetratricopeptide repeat protein [Cyanobacteria bacterium CAN_BIN43]
MTDISSRKILGQNQLTYQRLKVSLSLNLRRQIFVAVCDDLLLRDRLATQLHTELAKSKAEPRRYPRLVSLSLNLNDPNPIVQIAQWLRQNPPPTATRRVAPMPAFQIMGVEQLTRQSAATQRLFFTHLQSIEHSLPLLESSLLIWTTQPWFRALPQSAPDFWHCRTGIFEFVGDPTPLQNSGTWEIGTSGSNICPGDLPQRDSQPDRPNKPDSARAIPRSDDRSNLAQRWNSSLERSLEGDSEESASESAPIVITIPAKAPAVAAAVSRFPTAVAVQVAADQDRASGGSSAVALLALEEEEEEREQEATLAVSAKQGALLPLPQQIELLKQRNAPELLVEAYRNFGNLYRDRIEQGDASPENITAAIQAYEKVLPLLGENSALWVDILNDLGSLYWMLSRTPFDLTIALHHLKKGILAYQLALTKVDLGSQAEVYPMVQCNLGAAYTDLARYQDPAQNLGLAIRSYQEALRLRGAEADPRRYASTQNNLGTTYWNLAQHQEPEVNLKAAIAAYSEALGHYDPAEEPLNYAMIQNNLGTAYWNLAQCNLAEGDRPQDWLGMAVTAYQLALQYRTVQAAPTAFAATQNNLGTAYWHIANQANSPAQKLDSLRQAIVAYEATLEAAEILARQQSDPAMPATLSFDLFATSNNLGLAYYQVATDSKAGLDGTMQSAYLESAMRHHVQAYQGWAPRPELQQTAFSCMVQTCRAFYSQLGIVGQNLALSIIPGQLLPEVLPKL